MVRAMFPVFKLQSINEILGIKWLGHYLVSQYVLPKMLIFTQSQEGIVEDEIWIQVLVPQGWISPPPRGLHLAFHCLIT